MSKREKRSVAYAHILLVIISIIWLIPFVFLVLQSFRSYSSEYGGMVSYIVPKAFSLDNYVFLIDGSCNFLKWYGNTLTIAFFVTIISTFFVICTSYALSRMRFAGRTFLMKFWLVL